MQIQKGHNAQLRGAVRSGWIGLLRGESAGSIMDRSLEALNEEGYRVVFIIEDRWSLGRHLQNILVGLLTLGFVLYSPGYLIIAERGEA